MYLCRYEDLKTDLVASVERMLDFLKFPYHHSQIIEKLKDDYTQFKRYALLITLGKLLPRIL